MDKKLLPKSLKREAKKREFQRILTETFTSVNVKDHMFDVLIFAMNYAELHFYSNTGEKRGAIKKESVLTFLRSRINSLDEPMTTNMLESLVSNIHKPTYLSRFKKFTSRIFHRPG
jgi:hypothetical protein